MRQYQKYMFEMFDAHKDLFASFKDIHDKYRDDPTTWQAQFNEEGAKVVDVIREYERKLCGNMSGGQYSKFSQNLSQKFWDGIKQVFPKIAFVGVK